MKKKEPIPRLSNFPGAIPVFKKIKQLGVGQVIREVLGERVPQAYQYDDALIGWLMTIYCQGFRLFRMENAKNELSMVPGLMLCSHDTIGRILKLLATESVSVTNKNVKKRADKRTYYKISDNDKMNDLLIQVTKKVGLLNEDTPYTLDMDATHVFSKSKDAKGMFKGGYGYTPMVCMINKTPVYISLRTGNANSHYMQKECLEQCLKLLEKHKIYINRVRIDGAGYNKEVTHFIQSKRLEFIIGADWDETTLRLLDTFGEWKKAPFKSKKHSWDNAEFSESKFVFNDDKHNETYRVVGVRAPERVKDSVQHKTKWRLHEKYYYKFLLTAVYFVEPQEIFEEYNRRGAIERNFDYLKNDFGWKTMPFSNINENLVHLIVSAIANNVYLAIVDYFAAKLKDTIKATFRLPNFLREFIKAGFFIVKRGTIRFFYAEITFEKLI